MNQRHAGQVAVTAIVVILAIAIGANGLARIVTARKVAAQRLDVQIRSVFGRPVPTFSVNMIDGSVLNPPLARPMLIYFISSTCGACDANRESWEKLVELAPSEVLSLAISFEPLDSLRSYVSSDGEGSRTGSVSPESHTILQEALKMWATPTLYGVDRDDVLRYSHLGLFDETTIPAALAARGSYR